MDTVSKKKRSEIMSKIRSKNTKPELRIRKYLHSMGFRYSLHNKTLPGTPDIFLKKHKFVIQVRGCFWHGHRCRLGVKPKTRKKFWKNKIQLTKIRDLKNDRKLRRMGYTLLVIRECELRSERYKEKVYEFLRKKTRSSRM